MAAISGGGSIAYTWQGCPVGNPGTGGNSTLQTYSVSIGTASADRLVVVGFNGQNAKGPIVSVVVDPTGANVTLNKDIEITTGGDASPTAMLSGLVTSTSGTVTINVTLTSGNLFSAEDICVWTVTGLASNVVKHTAANDDIGGGSNQINLTAGDLLFAISRSGKTFAGSTVAPTAAHSNGNFATGADWSTSVTVTNAAFTIDPGGGSSTMAAASYR